MKRLTSVFTRDYVRFALGSDVGSAEPLVVEEQDKELPALSREVDFVARVGWQEEEALLLMEFQTVWQGDMPRRMAGYTWRLYERYDLPVHPVVVVLRPGGLLETSWRMVTWGRPVASCTFDVMALWEVDAGAVMEQELTGLYPLLPLMRWEEESEPASILERSQRLILEGIVPREARADAYVGLRVLSGIRYPWELVQQILHRRELMLESPAYREILEEGRQAGREEGLEQGLEKGLEQGLEKGLEQGREQGLRDDVLAALEVRFGSVPAALAERVREMRGRPELEALLRRAIVVESLEEFVRELG